MMKKLVLAGVFIALFLSGCFNISTVVNVKKDGSGTVEQSVLFRKDFLEQMKGFGQSFGGKTEEKDSDVYDIEKLKKEAADYGENVRYVSSKKIEKDNMVGYRVVYAFDNIDKLSLNENPGADIMSSGKNDEQKQDNIKFRFKKGGASELTINFPILDNTDDSKTAEDSQTEENSDEETLGDGMNDAAAAMIKQMYAGMKMSLKIKLDGKIVKTNASNVDGNTITLVEMNFDEILKDPTQLKKLQNANPENQKEMKKILKNAKGIKVETQDQVKIKFK